MVVPAGTGVKTIDQVLPFQCSTSRRVSSPLVLLDDPTAKQFDHAAQSTLDSEKGRPPGTACTAWTNHLVPFQWRITVRPCWLPVVVQYVFEMHVMLPDALAPAGSVCTDHLVPFQCSITPAVAKQLLVVGHATDDGMALPAKVCRDHFVPFQRSISAITGWGPPMSAQLFPTIVQARGEEQDTPVNAVASELPGPGAFVMLQLVPFQRSANASPGPASPENPTAMQLVAVGHDAAKNSPLYRSPIGTFWMCQAPAAPADGASAASARAVAASGAKRIRLRSIATASRVPRGRRRAQRPLSHFRMYSRYRLAAVRAWPRSRDARTAVGLVAVALLPFLVLAIRLVGRSHVALNGDDALINLRVHDVFTSHTPLLGSYERYGFNQPGPAWFYFLAVPFRLLGTRFSGIQIGVILVHALSVVLVARVMYRRFGTIAMAWSLLVLTALFWGFGPRVMTDPWEPHVSAVLLVTVAVLAFDATSGALGAWVWLVLIASLATQMYATAGVIAALLLCWGLVVGGVRLVRAGDAAALGRRLAVSAGVAALLWLPPLVQEVRDHPGNLTATWRFVREPHVRIGLRSAFGALRLETWFPAVWLGHSVPLVPFATTVDVHGAPWFPGALVVLLGVALVAGRARAVPQLTLVATVALAAGLTVITLSRLSTPFFVWLVEPTRAAGALLWLPVGTLGVLLPNARLRSAVTTAAAGALVVVVVALSVRAARDDLGPERADVAVGRLAEAAAPVLRHGSGPVIARTEVRNQLFAESIFGHDDLTVDLALAGIDMVSGSKPGDIDAATRFGAFRAHPERATREVLLQADGASVPAGGRVIARADPLRPAERAARNRLETDVGRVCGVGDLHVLRRCRAEHPQVAGWLDRLNAIPDLPSLQLVLLPLTPGV